MKFGDRVLYDLTKSHGGVPEEAYVIGFHRLSVNGDLPIVATEKAHGMAINAGHCVVLSSGHDVVCERLRDRYHSLYPTMLQERKHENHSNSPATGSQ